MWAAVAAYVIWAGASARRVRMAKRVGGLEIEVVDSSSQGHLVSAAMVRGWISQSGIETIGTAVDAVDLTGIERLIARKLPQMSDVERGAAERLLQKVKSGRMDEFI